MTAERQAKPQGYRAYLQRKIALADAGALAEKDRPKSEVAARVDRHATELGIEHDDTAGKAALLIEAATSKEAA